MFYNDKYAFAGIESGADIEVQVTAVESRGKLSKTCSIKFNVIREICSGDSS